MNAPNRVGILGTGSYAPAKVLRNQDLERMVDTTDEWILSRTGIRERRVAAPEESTATMALEAARSALDAARTRPEELDLIIVGTVTPDFPFPATACLLQKELGAERAGAFDLSAACSAFLYALAVGAKFVASGSYRKVLVVGADCLSRVIDYRDRASCILFGDGAGAAVLSSEFERGEVLPHAVLGADGRGDDVIYVRGGGSKHPLTCQSLEQGEQYMRIRGREVYRFAVSRFVELVQDQLAAYPDLELGMVVPHQVNQRIIDSARERLGLPEEKVFSNIDRYGNTSAASIPLALDELIREGVMDTMQGKLIVFCAFGAGLTWASAAMRW